MDRGRRRPSIYSSTAAAASLVHMLCGSNDGHGARRMHACICILLLVLLLLL